MTCSECDRPVYFAGRCSLHYKRLMRDRPRTPTAAEVDEFNSHVDQRGPEECWEWTGKRGRGGYGSSRLAVGGGGYAHRAAYILTHGPIPSGANVCHTCDNPPCCNPSHLFAGPFALNMADKIAKGRHPKGESHPAARLTADIVLEARAEYAAGGISHRELAERYGVSGSAMRAAVNGTTWSHIS